MEVIVAYIKSNVFKNIIGIIILLALFLYFKGISSKWDALNNFCKPDKESLSIQEFTVMVSRESLVLTKPKAETWMVRSGAEAAAGPDEPVCIVQIKDNHVEKIQLDSPVYQ